MTTLATVHAEGAPADHTAAELLERIRTGIIGEGEILDGPYGPRRVTYADYTASGRALDFIESFIRNRVLPLYANTHTESSGTGRQTTALREEARRSIHASVGGGDEHVVIFTGSGATAAVNKLIGILGLRAPDGSAVRRDADEVAPVVFIGPYEHHSNELPWRETIADVVTVDADVHGRIDPDHLEALLERYAERPLRIGSFSAASNVTGVLTDTDRITSVLHRHGALSFWDYAAAGPYVPIRMTASAPGAEDHKDAVFLSPHKFVGGPQTPGVLVVDQALVRNDVPTAPGGSTVEFVSPSEHRYLSDPVAREEGGTPAIVESIRAGLVFRLKDAVGADVIQRCEEQHWRHALQRWANVPTIDVLGDHAAARLSIVSFRIRAGDRFLHHNFVVALLNDLFGIQARGGCSCAGPYGHRLLSVEDDLSTAYRDVVHAGCAGIKPGWARVNFNYFVSDVVRDYIVEAVELIARFGPRLLPEYEFNPRSGLWRNRQSAASPPVRLVDLRFGDGEVNASGEHRHETLAEDALARHLADARELFASRPDPHIDESPTGLTPEFEKLRWFPLPASCL